MRNTRRLGSQPLFEPGPFDSLKLGPVKMKPRRVETLKLKPETCQPNFFECWAFQPVNIKPKPVETLKPKPEACQPNSFECYAFQPSAIPDYDNSKRYTHQPGG